ncbi:MAG: virulence factor SrfB [Thiohalocapsa sp. PB-PSB1]|jgi:hypothetical protein|nr:MAG: virulence factor SrfB [Thiohalocapsa sp. PB-PSB1]
MLAKPIDTERKVTLIADSGVQFLDFALTLDLRKEPAGEFIPQESNRSLGRLVYDEHQDRYYWPDRPDVPIKSELSVPVDESARLLDGLWLPLPLLRINPPRRFAPGPETWARARLVELTERETADGGQTHQLTLAIDTSVFEDADDIKYLAPTQADVAAGVSYAFAHRADEIGWFPELPWVAGWIEEIFTERASSVLRLPAEDLEAERKRLVHHAHYLNLLAIVGHHLSIPEIKLRGNGRDQIDRSVPVDMVLDVGNSRTCGILIEQHAKEGDVLGRRYELVLRDLSRPERVCGEPFESRVELAQVTFGKEHWAHKSGRADAFLWPTIARIGPEAARLAGRRRGTEGATGISSPKRYLWDEERFDNGWRFNNAYVRSEIEPMATAAPLCNLINETGSALYELPEAERMPVFMPHYTRSAMMMFMLAEVLTQALGQINSPAQRLRMPNADLPRHLRTLILTVPPSMPIQEREIFAERMQQAMGVVWKAFGWHPEDDPVDGDGGSSAFPPFPTIEVRWDEATCCQAVYLFTEIQNTFAGRPEELFRHGQAARRRDAERDGCLMLATVDIGGGTTDLVINEYRLEGGQVGGKRIIVPRQRFRDGFKVAGDDILLEIINQSIVPALQLALAAAGVADPTSLLSRMIGSDPLDVQESVQRQQLALQVLYPAGLSVQRAYEGYDPIADPQPRTASLRDLVAESSTDMPTAPVLNWVADNVKAAADAALPAFDLLDVPVLLDLARLHRLFQDDRLELVRAVKSLCEIVHLYDCDVLLLTGRPSRLPGVRNLFQTLLPLPPDRILTMHDYRTGAWYPFNRRGRIDDPKSTAAVGAMLCLLGQGRLPNFFLRANALHAYSTIRYLGPLDRNMMIKSDEVVFADVDLDDPDYQLPDTPIEMRGIMHIGYRQLAAQRWTAAPLYLLDFADDSARRAVYDQGAVLEVRLERTRGRRAARFRVAGVEVEGGRSVSRNSVALKLNTLSSIGFDQDSYWLDSGSVLR